MGMIEYITDEGFNLLNRMLSGECNIKFTKVEMGSGYPNELNYKKVRALTHPIVALDVDEVRVSENKTVRVTAIFTNAGLSEGFYFREKGVYATDGQREILFAYANARDDAGFIDPPAICMVEKKVISYMTQLQGEEGEVRIDVRSGIYVCTDDFVYYMSSSVPEYSVPEYDQINQYAIKDKDRMSTILGKIRYLLDALIGHISHRSNPHDVTKEQIGLGSVDNTADEDKYVKGLKTSEGTANVERRVYFADTGATNTEARLVYDDDFKYNPVTNTLTVKQINGNAASSTKAIQDGDGNIIANTYAKNTNVSYGVHKSINFSSVSNIQTPGWIRITPAIYYGTALLLKITKGYSYNSTDGFFVSICTGFKSTPIITQLGAKLLGEAITKIRCVYNENNIYVELYANKDLSKETLNFDLFGFNQLSFSSGSVPSGFSTTELVLSDIPIASNQTKTVTTAEKAFADGNGNIISSTYLPLTGGTLTGNKSYIEFNVSGMPIMAGTNNNNITFKVSPSGVITCEDLGIGDGYNYAVTGDTVYQYLIANYLPQSNGVVKGKLYWENTDWAYTPGMGIVDFRDARRWSQNYLYVGTDNGAFSIAWTPSDEALKKNVKKSNEEALDKIQGIDFIEYDWKDEKLGHVDLGISANQLENIIPSAVFHVKQPEGSEHEYLRNLNSQELTVYSLKAIQELYDVVLEQREIIEQLRNDILDLYIKYNS